MSLLAQFLTVRSSKLSLRRVKYKDSLVGFWEENLLLNQMKKSVGELTD